MRNGGTGQPVGIRAGQTTRTRRPEIRTSPTPRRLELIGAFESTYMPAHDVDIIETSGHDRMWRDDLALLRRLGATRLRYPIRWHRIEESPGRYRWSETDAVMDHMREEGMRPIIDLVHHTSHPRWLTGGFGDRRFGPHYLRFCEAVAARYGWVEEYTLFNEPFATLFLSGHEAVWPPYAHGMDGFVGLVRNVLPAVAEASRMFRELLPAAAHVWVDSCEGHTALDPVAEPYTHLCNDRRFFLLDALLGRAGDTARPFVRAVLEGGGEDLLAIEPGHIDVLGLDYYAHHEWAYRRGEGAVPIEVAGKESHPHGPGHPQVGEVAGCVPSSRPRGLAALAVEYWEHFRIGRMMLGETNMAGAASDRATWLKHTLEQCERACAAGVPLEAYCWFGFLDSLDWHSLLARHDRHIDPVGVIGLDERLRRQESSMSRAWSAAAAGAPAAHLPAYRLTPPVREWLAGLMPLMAHYAWEAAPVGEVAVTQAGVTCALPLDEGEMVA